MLEARERVFSNLWNLISEVSDVLNQNVRFRGLEGLRDGLHVVSACYMLVRVGRAKWDC